MSELLKAVWDFDISICPDCGHSSMKQLGRCYAPSWLSWLLILFWKSLPTGGFESMSCNVLHHKNQRVFSWFLIIFDDFGHLGTIQSPYKNWLKYRDWVQYERITFRAVPIYCRTALFVNSESDTFLMNYITAMTDAKTGNLVEMSRSTVQRHRVNILNKLRQSLEHNWEERKMKQPIFHNKVILSSSIIKVFLSFHR